MRGECLACSRVNRCTETNIERMKRSYTCPLFESVPEPLYAARYDLIQQFGVDMGMRAIRERTQEEEQEE